MDYRVEKKAKKMNDAIIDRLIAYRIQLHMTQQDIAESTGIARPNIARMESKKYISSVENLMKYAQSIGKELRFEIVDLWYTKNAKSCYDTNKSNLEDEMNE